MFIANFNTKNTPPPPYATLSRRSLWSLLLFALFTVCGQAQAQQNATGAPAVTAADRAARRPQRIILCLSNSPAFFAATHSTPPAAGPGLMRTMILRGFLPLILLPLVIACGELQAQDNATGMPAVTYASGITVPTEGSAITATQGTIEDPDNTPTTGLGSIQWIWSQADTNGGTYTPVHLAATFTPLQAHVGKFLRICVSFRDNTNNDEERCLQIATAVAANDAPTSDDAFVNALATATADSPYAFKIGDFPFMDEDTGAALTSITIVETIASGTGTLRDGSTAVADGTTVMAANLSGLTYYPPANATPAANFASFTFTVSDGAADSADDYTMTINLVEHLRLRLRLFLEGPLR